MKIVQRRAAAEGDIEDLTNHPFTPSRGGEQIGLHHIGDRAKITRRASVAIDDTFLPTKHPVDPERNDRRVPAARILPRTEDIKITQPDRFLPEALQEKLGIDFADPLRSTVGRKRLADLGFFLRQTRIVPINRTAARIDNTSNVVFPGRLEDI